MATLSLRYEEILKIEAERSRVDKELLDHNRRQILEKLLVSFLLGENQEIGITYEGSEKSTEITESVHEKNDHIPELNDFLLDMVAEVHPGWHRDDGGYGTVDWDVTADKITIDHNEKIVTYASSTHEV